MRDPLAEKSEFHPGSTIRDEIGSSSFYFSPIKVNHRFKDVRNMNNLYGQKAHFSKPAYDRANLGANNVFTDSMQHGFSISSENDNFKRLRTNFGEASVFSGTGTLLDGKSEIRVIQDSIEELNTMLKPVMRRKLVH